ncbi:MAG: YceI family protein [Balneolaceae bacterium]|nr:MAG: YceI family protein [Balneolaceae bacterium]
MTLRTLLFSLFFIFISLSLSNAQSTTYTLAQINQFTIDGGSNVRSWDADITSADGTLELNSAEGLALESIGSDTFRSLTLSLPVSGIESGTRGLTRNLQGYLKGDEYPIITFSLTEVTEVAPADNGALISANGVVTAAGVTHEISMSVQATVNSDYSLSFQGSQPLLMTSFEISPPTAVMGTVRANDEIEILFDVVFIRN